MKASATLNSENTEKSGEFAALERKSPHFAEKREGWGTLKFIWVLV